eukprot:PhF_6_TR27882/c0_g2_i2/m.40821
MECVAKKMTSVHDAPVLHSQWGVVKARVEHMVLEQRRLEEEEAKRLHEELVRVQQERAEAEERERQRQEQRRLEEEKRLQEETLVAQEYQRKKEEEMKQRKKEKQAADLVAKKTAEAEMKTKLEMQRKYEESQTAKYNDRRETCNAFVAILTDLEKAGIPKEFGAKILRRILPDDLKTINATEVARRFLLCHSDSNATLIDEVDMRSAVQTSEEMFDDFWSTKTTTGGKNNNKVIPVPIVYGDDAAASFIPPKTHDILELFDFSENPVPSLYVSDVLSAMVARDIAATTSQGESMLAELVGKGFVFFEEASCATEEDAVVVTPWAYLYYKNMWVGEDPIRYEVVLVGKHSNKGELDFYEIAMAKEAEAEKKRRLELLFQVGKTKKRAERIPKFGARKTTTTAAAAKPQQQQSSQSQLIRRRVPSTNNNNNNKTSFRYNPFIHGVKGYIAEGMTIGGRRNMWKRLKKSLQSPIVVFSFVMGLIMIFVVLALKT